LCQKLIVRLSSPPNLCSDRRIVVAAVAVTFAASIGLIAHSDNLARTLGDPDDAMRLSLVRDLLAGRGWYDQLITRLQPPTGVFLHWSRLLDGALSMWIKAFEVVLPPQTAETAVRFVWPLFWILPATLCALAISRRLGGSLAVFICAVLLASNQQAFEQFVPGRIDHHNIQIVMTMIAAACAMAEEQRPRWAPTAGAATGLGLAIGIEALPFHLLIGTSYALRAAAGEDDARTTRNYALSLAGATLVFYGLQTPPWRWSMSFCDASGLNLTVAIGIMSCGLFAVTIGRVQARSRARTTVLIGAAVVAVTAYFALNPACIHGPLAAIDPRIRPFWFNVVDEMQPLPVIVNRYRDLGTSLVWMSGLMIAAAIFVLARAVPRPEPAKLLASVLVFVATIAGFEAFRMQSYVFWLGFPLLASAFSVMAMHFWRGLMLPTVIVCVLLSPAGAKGISLAERTVIEASLNHSPPAQAFRCHDTAEYVQLQKLSPGLVLADISIGPFILATTRHSVLNAPYHRMVWGILASHEALTAKVSDAQRRFRELKVDYLVECRSGAVPPVPGSIGWDLGHGQVPSWLQSLSENSQALQIYRVRS
jgi:hypothetical protein